MILPDFVLACSATLALIVRAKVAGELPDASYYAAWEALPAPDDYCPTEELEEWMRLHWQDLTAAGKVDDSESRLLACETLETLDLAREWPRSWMPDLIAAYSEAGGVMTEACKAINKSDETVRLWRHRDLAFRAALEAVERQRDGLIRAVIHNHAIEGVLEPVIGSVGDYRDGQLTGPDGKPLFIRKFDHRLLVRYAEAHLPEYQRKTESTTIHNNVSATASASATSVVVPPEKIVDLQARRKRQMEKAAQRANQAKIGSN